MTPVSIPRRRVLIVDDESGSRTLMARVLAKAGFEVEAVATAQEAERSAAARRPDALLVDRLLPGCFGVDLARTLRALYPDLAVVVVSAVPGAEIDLHVADATLLKPFPSVKLLPSAVRGALAAHFRQLEPSPA